MTKFVHRDIHYHTAGKYHLPHAGHGNLFDRPHTVGRCRCRLNYLYLDSISSVESDLDSTQG